MLRIHIIFIGVALLAAPIKAQIPIASALTPHEPAVMEAFYDYTGIDTVLATIISEDFVLQIGETTERFYAAGYYYNDSLIWANGHKALKPQPGELHIVASAQIETNWWRYKEQDVFEQRNIFNGDIYVSIDSLAVQDWTIASDDTLTVCGYLCQKATCSFRGRDWTVWFAPDIPFASGPWKLHGLPGLILKAETSDQMILLTATSVHSAPAYPIERMSKWVYDRLVYRTTPKKAWEMERMEAVEPETFNKAYAGRAEIYKASSQPLTRTVYCPFEKEMD